MMTLFDIDTIAFEAAGYPVSYVELIATLFGLISVYLASRANILTWSTGLVNIVFLFILFFQVQLYADMFLQLYFFIMTIYGWYHWKQKPNLTSITGTNLPAKLWIVALIVTGTVLFGFLFSHIHLYLPHYFKIPASFPYTDSLVMVLSVIATVLLAQKKLETWYLWIAVDVVCVVLFFKKGIVFLAVEYMLFLILATYGLYNWKRQLTHG